MLYGGLVRSINQGTMATDTPVYGAATTSPPHSTRTSAPVHNIPNVLYILIPAALLRIIQQMGGLISLAHSQLKLRGAKSSLCVHNKRLIIYPFWIVWLGSHCQCSSKYLNSISGVHFNTRQEILQLSCSLL